MLCLSLTFDKYSVYCRLCWSLLLVTCYHPELRNLKYWNSFRFFSLDWINEICLQHPPPLFRTSPQLVVYFSELFTNIFFGPSLRHVGGIEPMPWQWLKPLQWQHQLLNLLCRKRTPASIYLIQMFNMPSFSCFLNITCLNKLLIPALPSPPVPNIFPPTSSLVQLMASPST